MKKEREYELPSGTCFPARRLEVVAVAGLLWIYFVVCFFSVWWDFVFLFFVFFTSNAHGLLQVRGKLASCTSLLVMRQGRGSKATEAVFCIQAKRLFIPGCVQGAIIQLFCPCLCVCVTFVVFTDCESCTRPISTNPGFYESGRVWANAWNVFFRAPSRGGRGRWADVGFVVCFQWGRFFLDFQLITFSNS